VDREVRRLKYTFQHAWRLTFHLTLKVKLNRQFGARQFEVNRYYLLDSSHNCRVGVTKNGSTDLHAASDPNYSQFGKRGEVGRRNCPCTRFNARKRARRM